MSNSWFYSKVAESGSSEKVGHGNMTVLSEEAEAHFDRECEVGDIRVGFDTEAMPIGVTVVAEQQDYRLMPIREEGQPVYILLDEQLEPEEVLGYMEKKMGLRLQWWRFLCGVFVFVGMLCRFDDGWPFPVRMREE